MNVEMPDGTIIADVPEGITRSELLRRYKAMAAPMPVEAPEAEDPGALMAGVIGAGRFADRLLKGAKQTALTLMQDDAGLEKMKAEENANTRIYAGLQAKRPVATTVGEIAPLIATFPAVGSVAGAAALGAVPGALEYGTGEERATRAAMGAAGGAIGAGAGKLIGRAIQPIRVQPTQAVQAAQVDKAEVAKVEIEVIVAQQEQPIPAVAEVVQGQLTLQLNIVEAMAGLAL